MNIDFTPLVSVIVPVLNEAAIIEQICMHLLAACSGYSREIIIVDGDPSGSTIKYVNSAQIQTFTAPCGRASQMNAGAKAARGRILLFVHADTRLPEGAIRDVMEACRTPSIAGGAFLLGIESEKRIFRYMGGYTEIPLMEDIEIMQRLKRKRLKIELIGKSVQTSARRWEKEGIVYAMIRNNLLSFLYYTGANPCLLNKFYRN
ncbi:MAG: TIGR04283 family arsenosugar biosynthesis glycosyltransferase [Desulfosalsimonas sp.]